ncbi:MAG: DsbA family oxidoreductase [Erythrobacter sp.]|jgi:predicted DsbA family dithiol-disulfide isomerase|nr:DsbA family oxidoreductase [Erythrobacter sp.]
MSAPQTLTIDIYSDVVCPWCAIGHGQLQQALADLNGEIDAEIRWRPFELNPDMAPEGEEQEAHLRRKYGRSAAEGTKLRDQMKRIAQDAGVSISYEGEIDGGSDVAPAMVWNTRDCHKLLDVALEQAGPEIQTRLKLALFEAHFNHRRNLSDCKVLLDIATAAGLHREAAKAALDDEVLEARIAVMERQAWDLNITGVPAMIIAGKFMVPGAQGRETYAAVLRKVATKVSAD